MPRPEAVIDFLGSEKGQAMTRDSGKEMNGRAIHNDADQARKYDH